MENVSGTLTMSEASLRPTRDTSSSSAINNLKGVEWGTHMTGTEGKPKILKRYTKKVQW